MKSPFTPWLALAFSLLAASTAAQAEPIVMASTTSTEQSGLFAHLLPAFAKSTGVEVKVVALGTGQAIDMGRRKTSYAVALKLNPLTSCAAVLS